MNFCKNLNFLILTFFILVILNLILTSDYLLPVIFTTNFF